jgi:hypothetical protein
MKIVSKVPIVVEGTPRRCKSRNTLAVLADVELEIREFASGDLRPAYVVRGTDHFLREIVVYEIGEKLYKPFRDWFPSGSDEGRDIAVKFETMMLMGGQDFATHRVRFGKAFDGRAVRQVWPRSVSETRVCLNSAFGVAGLKALPSISEADAPDVDEAEVERWRSGAVAAADNVVVVDGRLHVRCAEPVIACGCDNEGLVIVQPAWANMHAEHLDSARFAIDADRRSGSYLYHRFVSDATHVFGHDRRGEAEWFAAVTATGGRGKPREVVRHEGRVEAIDRHRAALDGRRYDALRFAKAAVAARSAIEYEITSPSKKERLRGDLAHVGWHEREIAKAIVAFEAEAGSLAAVEEQLDLIVSACGQLEGRVSATADTIIAKMAARHARHRSRQGTSAAVAGLDVAAA